MIIPENSFQKLNLHKTELMNPIRNLRNIGNIEGISYLVLLGIAMPLKYMGNMPKAVTIVGGIHGFLFVLFVIALLIVWRKKNWSYDKVAFAFMASIIPFGTFYLDKKLRKEELTN
jgi:integral membrane protein